MPLMWPRVGGGPGNWCLEEQNDSTSPQGTVAIRGHVFVAYIGSSLGFLSVSFFFLSFR